MCDWGGENGRVKHLFIYLFGVSPHRENLLVFSIFLYWESSMPYSTAITKEERERLQEEMQQLWGEEMQPFLRGSISPTWLEKFIFSFERTPLK